VEARFTREIILISQKNIDEIKASGFTRVMLWTVHVHGTMDFYLNDDLIVTEGSYVGDAKWPSYIKSLKSNQTSVSEIYLSLGSEGSTDFDAIALAIQCFGTGNNSIIYKNFMALRTALPDIDGVDLVLGSNVIATYYIQRLSVMLGKMGLKVSFCPSLWKERWLPSLYIIERELPGTVSQFNLRCYNEGQNNDPADWQQAINSTGLKIPVYPGLTPSQSSLEAIQVEFTSWKGEGVTGGFLFLYDDILRSGLNASQFAEAIKNGLNVTMSMNRSNNTIGY